MYEILLYYKYVNLKDAEAIRLQQVEMCKRLGLKGRIIIADEGINGTVEGEIENTSQYISEMQQIPEFADIWFKRSLGIGNAFPKLSIKIRDEIVTTGITGLDPAVQTGKYITAEELHELIHSKSEFYIVDMRNDYEHKSGFFAGSVLAPIENFRDLPTLLPKLESLKNKIVVTVCTGGVRCEKASAFLLQSGFNNVYQLHGGIVTYMEQYPNEDFLGQLYVFDGRLTMGFNVDSAEHVVVGRCEKCNLPSVNYINCSNNLCHRHFILCKQCIAKDGAYCDADCQKVDAALQKVIINQTKSF